MQIMSTSTSDNYNNIIIGGLVVLRSNVQQIMMCSIVHVLLDAYIHIKLTLQNLI